MSLTTLIVWLLLILGMAYLLTGSAIFANARYWIRAKSSFFGKLLSCAPCTSFWLGILWGTPYITTDWFTFIVNHIFGGFVAMGFIVVVQLATAMSIAEDYSDPYDGDAND